MELSIITALMQPTIPSVLIINDWGVITNGIIKRFQCGKASIEFRMCFMDGVWKGAYSVTGRTCGMGCPLSRSDSGFPTLELCLDHVCENVKRYVRTSIPDSYNKTFQTLEKWKESNYKLD